MARRAQTAAAGIAAALAIGAAATPADARPKLHDGATGFKVRPAAILVSGDGSAWLGGAGADPPGGYGRIHWTRFRRSGAVGHGRYFVNDCNPDCAGGTFTSLRATIRASRVRNGRFTRLQARYQRDGESLVTRWKLQVNSPSYAYWFALPPTAK